MANPGQMAGVSTVLTIGSSILGAQGAKMSAEAEAQRFQYQAGIARINKQIAEQNADYSRQVGEVQAQKSGMTTRATIGQQKAVQSGRGVDVNTGSAAKTRESTQEIGDYDQAIIRSNAARRAYGFQVEASKEDAQSRVLETASQQSLKAGRLNVVSSLLGGASTVASRWSQASSIGIGTSPSGGGYTQRNPTGSWAPEDI